MPNSNSAAPIRPELLSGMAELAHATGATPSEVEAAAREWAASEAWKADRVQEALDDEAAGDAGRPAEEVFAEFRARVEERLTRSRE